MTMRTLAVLLLAALPGLAQISAGLKVGAPLNDVFDQNRTGFSTETRRYIVGPELELRLPWGLGIEVDALYSRYDLRSPFTAVGSLAGSVVDGDSWEFPVIVKKRFGRRLVKPFVGAGASFRRLGDLGNLGDFFFGSRRDETVRDRMNRGFVVGGGLEIKLLFLRVSPEIRFTRWGTEHFSEGVTNIFNTNKNQGQLLVGISF